MAGRWLLLLVATLIGCGPAISTGLQTAAGPPVSFAQLAAHPETYQGRLEILGGLVMGVEPWGNRGSRLTVDQRPLDARLFPVGPVSGGTFVVESEEWLNSAWYVPKSKVVVAGVVAGARDGLVVLKAREVRLLEPPTWEKYYYPVPREWYPPELEYWYTPPYFDIYRGGRR
jgi:starvation-inducible outer membrane lipoprotein